MSDIKLLELEKPLSKFYGDEITILEKTSKVCTEPGEHYGSVILAVDLKIKLGSGEIKTLNLVSKVQPVNELLKIAFDVNLTFKKEVFTYNETIPALLEFQKQYNFPEEKLLNIFPKCYCARLSLDKDEVDENALLLFENLKLKGYSSVDRLTGCNLEEILFVVKYLAIFHAVPLAMKKLNVETFIEKVGPTFPQHSGVEQLDPEIGLSYHNTIMEVASTCPELEPYLNRIEVVVKAAEKQSYLIKPPPSEDFGTLIHSDLWTSNFMLARDDDGKLEKFALLDYQMLSYNSPIRDLVFLLFTSVQSEILKEHIDEIIKVYYDSFVDTLKGFNIDLTPYSWSCFMKELNEVAPLEVYHILFMLKVIFVEKGKVTNTIDKFEISDWTRKDLLGKNHQKKLIDIVVLLASKNWI